MADQTTPPDGGAQKFRMIDVGGKQPTARRAMASGRIRMSAAAFDALARGQNPKGDVLAQAEVAGMMAAKRTADLLPLCHPLPLDQVVVRFELVPAAREVVARCEAAATAKTGVEMEVLAGVCGALLAVYDLCKAVDPVLLISDVHLEVKEGGKSGRWVYPAGGPA
jgi:cyclic pyranopterin phosphate synthase